MVESVFNPSLTLIYYFRCYTVCGPWSATKHYYYEYLTTRIKTYRAEILPEDSFHVPLDNREAASSKLKYIACNSRKGDRARWSLVRHSGKQPEKKKEKNVIVSTRQRDFSNISGVFFYS